MLPDPQSRAVSARAPIPAFPRPARPAGEGALSRTAHLIGGRSRRLSQSKLQRFLCQPVASLRIKGALHIQGNVTRWGQLPRTL